MAEERIEPRGEWRMDLRFAMLMRTVIALVSKKVPRLDQLMPKFGEPVEQQTVEDMRTVAMGWIAKARAAQRGEAIGDNR